MKANDCRSPVTDVLAASSPTAWSFALALEVLAIKTLEQPRLVILFHYNSACVRFCNSPDRQAVSPFLLLIPMATSANANHPMTTMDRCRRLGEMAYKCAITIGSMVLVVYMVQCFGDFLRAAPRPRELVNLWDLLVVMLPAYAFMIAACYQSFKLAHYIARVVLTTNFTTGVSVLCLGVHKSSQLRTSQDIY